MGLSAKLSTYIASFLFSCIIAYPVYAEPTNLSVAKHQVVKYYNSGTYHKEIASVINKANQYIINQVKHNKRRQKLAIVLDIDETSLSNYQNMYAMDFNSKDHRTMHCYTMKANAPAIKPTLALYKNALKHGIKVFFITGRPTYERTATIKNLHYAGYKKWAGLYLRSKKDKKISTVEYKSRARAKIMKKGYKIIANIGDQCSDLKGGYALKGFKLPNPFYYLP